MNEPSTVFASVDTDTSPRFEKIGTKEYFVFTIVDINGKKHEVKTEHDRSPWYAPAGFHRGIIHPIKGLKS